jgi:hypothetical protein
MKKLLLLSMSAACMFFATAQVTVDWSVQDIPNPSELNSTPSGTSLDATVVLKNLGPDAVIAGDTLLYQLIFRNADNSLIFALPDGSFYFTIINKTIASGDTMQLQVKRFVPVKAYPSIAIKYQVSSYVTNNSRGLKLENNANNLFSKDMVWYNEQHWPLNTSNISMSNASVTPTVFKNELSVVVHKVVVGETAVLNIYNMQGALVKTQNLNSDVTNRINTESLSNGVYILKVIQGSDVYTTKVVKN